VRKHFPLRGWEKGEPHSQTDIEDTIRQQLRRTAKKRSNLPYAITAVKNRKKKGKEGVPESTLGTKGNRRREIIEKKIYISSEKEETVSWRKEKQEVHEKMRKTPPNGIKAILDHAKSRQNEKKKGGCAGESRIYQLDALRRCTVAMPERGKRKMARKSWKIHPAWEPIQSSPKSPGNEVGRKAGVSAPTTHIRVQWGKTGNGR